MDQNICKSIIQSIRGKYLYRLPKRGGGLSTEDLWDLTPEQLDAVYRQLEEQLKSESASAGLINRRATKRADEIRAKMDVVKFVFDTLRQEAKERENKEQRRKQLQKLLELKEARKEQAMAQMPDEELDALIAELSAGI